jgi:hypothetical protein
MDNSTQISEDVKNKLYAELSDLLLRALENNAIDAESAQDASAFILERIDQIEDALFLEAFLEELVDRWYCFQPILLQYQQKAEEEQSQQGIQNIQNQIDQLNQ